MEDDKLFENVMEDHFENYIENSSGIQSGNTDLNEFLEQLIKTFGIGYSKFEPFINGNYAVFMEHGTWFHTLEEYSKKAKGIPITITNYISLMNTTKVNEGIGETPILGSKFGNLLKFSQTITDISLPEPNKEYMAISTRQKNSFINTRDFIGSDFSMNFMDNSNLDIFKYFESWHKSIDLIREGLFFNDKTTTGKEFLSNIAKEDYLLENPYCNTVWVTILDSKGINLRGIIALFGIMPMNIPLKSLIGDRGSPKISTYNLNFKFMDIQYSLVDGWSKLQDVANKDKADSTLESKFFKFLGYKKQNSRAVTLA